MNLNLLYNKEKDIWCLLNKGKSSNNSPNPTPVYQKLISKAGDNPTEANTSLFIDEYLNKNNLHPEEIIKKYEKEFESIYDNFQSIAEKVFNVSLNKNITVYLTVNTRCPYNIKDGWFFVSMSKGNPVLTMMHELWHFYTWEKFGNNWLEKLGNEKYNDIKESLSVLLNIECKHLLPEGVEDNGYPQHQELRKQIIELWNQNHDIDYVWKNLI